MILDSAVGQDGQLKEPTASLVQAVKEKRPRKKRQPITYVSRHFVSENDGGESSTPKLRNGRKDVGVKAESEAPVTPPATPAKPRKTKRRVKPRVYHGLNVDELSSDSDLTDVPVDIGPDPFPPSPELVAIKSEKKTRKTKPPTISPYFPGSIRHKPRPHFLSTLPFPPLSAPTFGLMQERLCHDPFRLLIATIFLNKTPGARAMPVFYNLMEQYPGPQQLATAEVADITQIIQKLGFQNQRAKKIVGLAKMWVEEPVEAGKRYGKRDYPVKGDGRDVKADEVLNVEDERVGWEISHLPGIGAYAHDSWRMFCRDIVLSKATGYNGEGAEQPRFEPEWKRCLPMDKELRAWMTWMWLAEGWVWNKETGDKERASEELMELARGGGIVVEEREKETLTLQSARSVDEEKAKKVEVPAGEVLERVIEEEN